MPRPVPAPGDLPILDGPETNTTDGDPDLPMDVPSPPVIPVLIVRMMVILSSLGF